MSQTLEVVAVAEQARRVADAAERRAAVVVRLLADVDGQREASELFDAVWSSDGVPLLPGHLLRAAAHAGSYLAGAWDGGRMVGAAFGFLGQQAAAVHLQSHVVGVDEGVRHRGVGFALKQHQRAWALLHGIDTVRWTYDPLVSRNAYFNLTKLGAEVVAYDADFYGPLRDGVNGGDETDRAHVAWALMGARAVEASEGRLGAPPVARLRAEGAPVALDQAADGRPAVEECRGAVLLCRVPTDIVALRRDAPGLAQQWRQALRAVFSSAFARGYTATGMTFDGWYVLERTVSARP